MSSGWSKVTQLAAVGDVTGDGRPDLVGRVGSEPMRIFPGDGKYGFAKPVWAPKYLNVFGKVGQYYWRTFEVPESIYETAGGTFVPIGGGTTQLQAARPVVAARGYDQVIGNGDWTGDGVPDLVVREAATGALWLLEVSGSRIGYKKSYLGNVAGYSLVN